MQSRLCKGYLGGGSEFVSGSLSSVVRPLELLESKGGNGRG
jgi:hypothetical protein